MKLLKQLANKLIVICEILILLQLGFSEKFSKNSFMFENTSIKNRINIINDNTYNYKRKIIYQKYENNKRGI